MAINYGNERGAKEIIIFQKKLKMLRVALFGLNTKELVSYIGCSRARYNGYENGNYKMSQMSYIAIRSTMEYLIEKGRFTEEEVTNYRDILKDYDPIPWRERLL